MARDSEILFSLWRKQTLLESLVYLGAKLGQIALQLMVLFSFQRLPGLGL